MKSVLVACVSAIAPLSNYHIYFGPFYLVDCVHTRPSFHAFFYLFDNPSYPCSKFKATMCQKLLRSETDMFVPRLTEFSTVFWSKTPDKTWPENGLRHESRSSGVAVPIQQRYPGKIRASPCAFPACHDGTLPRRGQIPEPVLRATVKTMFHETCNTSSG